MEKSKNRKSTESVVDAGLIKSRELYDAFQELDQVDSDETERGVSAEPTEEDLEEESMLSYEEGLADGMALDDELKPNISEVVVKKREDTRSTLAIIYVLATFLIFFAAMGIAVLDGLNRDVSIIDNLSEVVPLFSGVFLGTLGFVLGYYFRKSDEDQKE